MNSSPKLSNSISKIKTYKSEYWANEQSTQLYINRCDRREFPLMHFYDLVNERFLQRCPAGSYVLDLGCGPGETSIFLADNACRVVACDISKPFLDHVSRNKGERDIEVRKGSAYAIPGADEEFDTVVARMLLPHFPDWHLIIKEMARCCKPGGFLMFQFASSENSEMAKQWAKEDASKAYYSTDVDTEGLPYAAECSNDEMLGLCKALSLDLVSIEPLNFFYFNKLLGYSVGETAILEYRKQLGIYLSDPVVRDFVFWFENEIVRNLPSFMTGTNIVSIQKPYALNGGSE